MDNDIWPYRKPSDVIEPAFTLEIDFTESPRTDLHITEMLGEPCDIYISPKTKTISGKSVTIPKDGVIANATLHLGRRPEIELHVQRPLLN